MKIQLEEYIRENGTNPYQTWFDGLNAQAAAKVSIAKIRLELGERKVWPQTGKETKHVADP